MLCSYLCLGYGDGFIIMIFSRIIISIIFAAFINLLFGYFAYKILLKDRFLLEESLLEKETDLIQKLIIDDIKGLFFDDVSTNNIKSVDNVSCLRCSNNDRDVRITHNSLQIKVENRCKIIEISKIRELLNLLSNKQYFYSIRINEELLLTNLIHDNKQYFYKKDILLPKGYKISIELSLINDSEFILNKKRYSLKLVKILFLYSFIFVVMITTLFFLYLYERNKKLGIIIDIANIKTFASEQNKFTIECYNFLLKQRKSINECSDDYFPLPLIDDIMQKKSVNIYVNEVFDCIKKYFAYYNQYFNTNNIVFNFNTLDEELNIPFEKELLKQILISTIFNLLNFSRKKLGSIYLKIDFCDNTFLISSNGFKLTKEIIIIASEKIFYDSFNPFIINFNQIIGILNRYNIKIDVYYNETESIVRVDFSGDSTVAQNDNGKIINIEKYRRKK